MKKKLESGTGFFDVILNASTGEPVKILHLNLKRKWFDMFLEGTKLEEYRELSPYWFSRFFNKDLTPKHYDFVCFRNGYSPLADEMIFEYHGVEVGLPNPHWTDKPGESCYIIKPGDGVYTNVN